VQDARVALYWDFENIHASVLEADQGEGTYRASFGKPQQRVVDIDSIVDHVAGLGSIVINRAYANWQWFSRYRFGLQSHAVDLVQLFPLGSGAKNGADIRLALDVMEDLNQQPHVTHVVVISGDSDFVGLAQKCRKMGKIVVGIGAGSTNKHWKAACDEFRSYRMLVGPTVAAGGKKPDREPAPSSGQGRDIIDPEIEETRDLDDAGDLLVRAIRSLASGTGEPWVRKGAVRPTVLRLDPSFNESAYGCSSFSALVSRLGDYVDEREGAHDHELAVIADLAEGRPGASGAAAAGGPGQMTGGAALLLRTLKKNGLILPDDRTLVWALPRIVCEVFAAAPGETLTGFDVFDRAVLDLLRRGPAPEAEERDARRIRSLMFRSRLFDLREERGIRLLAAGPDEVQAQLLRSIVSRMPDVGTEDFDKEDLKVLATLLCGDNPTDAQEQALHQAFDQVVAEAGEPASQGPGGD
jgi:hypothetical protein